MRMWTAALLVGAVALVSSCSSGQDGRAEDKAAAEPGVHLLDDFPLAQRSGPAFVWTGDRVFVWGGATVEDDDSSDRTSLGDGAVLLPSGEWQQLSKSPYPHGLYRPVGAWDGTEAIIIGSDCDESIPPDTTGEPPRCDAPAALAWNPTSDRWRRLSAPPIPVDPDSGQAVLRWGGTAVGGEGRALFVDDRSGVTLVWDRESEGWATVPSPTGGPVMSCGDPTQPWIVAQSAPKGAGAADVRLWTIRPTGNEPAVWSDGVDPQAAADPTTCGAGFVVGSIGFDVRLIDVGTGVASSIPVPQADEAATPSGDVPSGEPVTTSASLVGWWLFTTTAMPLAPLPTTTPDPATQANPGPGPTLTPPVNWSSPLRSVRLAPDSDAVPFDEEEFNLVAWARTVAATDRGIVACDLRENLTCKEWVAPKELGPPRR